MVLFKHTALCAGHQRAMRPANLGTRQVARLLVLAALWATVAGRTLSQAPAPAAVPCPTQRGNATLAVDPDTPPDACARDAPGGPSGMVLVLSDEFSKAGRDFSMVANDSLWSAADMYYAATQDLEVYKPTAVTTRGGSAVITTTRNASWAYTQAQDGSAHNVRQDLTSGMLHGWHKQCFTGGYVEVRAKLPGPTIESGLWPAVWMMGSLGKPGYLASTGPGLWPLSNDNCSSAAAQPWSSLAPQAISSCPGQPSDAQRAAWGLRPGQGRGVPEIDIAEVVIPGGNTATNKAPPRITQSLQMAPLLPPNTNWVDPAFYQERGLPMGYSLPGAAVEPFKTKIAEWFGDLTPQGSPIPRPGGAMGDCYSSQSSLNDSYYAEFHTYGVLWDPEDQLLRFTIDDVPTFEINKHALAGACNAAGQCVGPRLIPVEPMYLVLNVALSNTFTPVRDDLPLPAEFEIDYVRVYQQPDRIDVGCSPPDYPTEQYIACNRQKFILPDSADAQLIRGTCPSA